MRNLRRVGERIAGYADSDPAEQHWSAPQPAMVLKQAFAGSAYAMCSRAFDGQARRGSNSWPEETGSEAMPARTTLRFASPRRRVVLDRALDDPE